MFTLILLLLTYCGFTIGIYKWMLPSQFASALSNWYLFVLCIFWPVWFLLMLAIDVSIMIWPIGDDYRKFEDVKQADPGPRKKEK